MKIKLLHPVLHDGHRVEAGQTGDVEEPTAQKLIASGAAVAVEEPEPLNETGNAALKEPEPVVQPEAGQPDATPTPLADDKSAGTERAESEAKPSKAAKEGK